MNNRINVTLLSAVLSLMLAAPHVAVAEDGGLPSYYPDSFQWQGRLQKVSVTDAELTINATRYEYDNIRVHSLNTEHSSVAALQPGMAVAFTFHPFKKNGKRVIGELWVLPPDLLIEE